MRTDDRRRLKEQRSRNLTDLQELNLAAERERRSLTADEQQRWNELEADVRRVDLELEADKPEKSNGSAATLAGDGGGEIRAIDRRMIEGIRSVTKGESRALTTAAAVSPGELSTTLFDRLRANSVVLESGIRTLQTDADSVTFPAITADVNPSWTAEAAAITPGDPTFAPLTATPRKLAHLVQIANELVDDSDPSILQVLNEHLFRVLGLKLDAGLLEGSGTPPEIRGMKNIAGIQTIAVSANGGAPTLDSIADAIALLEAVNVPLDRIRVVAHPRNVATFRKAKASTGGTYLWDADPASATPTTVFGAPLFASAQLATNEVQGTSGAVTNSIYVYDTESVVWVNRNPSVVEVDRSRLFNSDQTEVRAKLRGDLLSPTPTGIVRVTGATA